MASITGTVLALSGNSGYDRNGDDFDILRDLLITADSIAAEPFAGVGLVTALDTLPNLTAFAPDDDAFKSLAKTIASVTGNDAPKGEAATVGFLADTLTLLGGGDASGLLTGILTYHVAGERISSKKLIADGGATTLSGGTFGLNDKTFQLIDNDPGVPNPALDLDSIDIGVDNGIIHVLEGVLLPLAVSGILTQKGTDFEVGGSKAEYFGTGKGADFIDGNGGSDIIRAGAGKDVAIGGTGHDWIGGGRGNDILIGENGNDTLLGGKGNDVIDGGGGRDFLVSGAGKDTFVFKQGSMRDTVIDFHDGNDMIDLSGYDGIDRFRDIKQDISGGESKSTIRLDDGDSIVLIGVSKDELDAGDFMFA